MRVRSLFVLVLVIIATLGAGIGALAAVRDDRQLSVGTIRLSIAPGHHGALDIYVPLVDWGVRFPAVRFPARLRVDVRAVDRGRVARIAEGDEIDVGRLRGQARDEIASYIRLAIVIAVLAAFAFGALVALALRGQRGPPLAVSLGAAGASALALGLALALTLPPRGALDDPEYYANGSDIPAALLALETATESSQRLSEELNGQLVGLARLIAAPAGRSALEPLPRLTLASDLHNNLLALPALEQASRDGPLFFAGDLTSNGSPFELGLVKRVVALGDPFVFVSGNHDSDVVARQLAREGAIVLTEDGRLLPDGRRGKRIVRVAGLRVAGYADPFERRSSNAFRREGDPDPDATQKRAFADWLAPLVGRVDVVMVHSRALTETAVDELRARPPSAPLVLLTGHTHESDLSVSENLVALNAGTTGGGGTGNFEKNQPFGLAVLTYELTPAFAPLAADLVEIDARSGSARAERRRLDFEPEPEPAK